MIHDQLSFSANVSPGFVGLLHSIWKIRPYLTKYATQPDCEGPGHFYKSCCNASLAILRHVCVSGEMLQMIQNVAWLVTTLLITLH